MSREITHAAKGPQRLDAGDFGEDGAIFVCRCGLSNDQPFCDGSHNATIDEAEGTRYTYENDESDGKRRVISEIRYVEA